MSEINSKELDIYEEVSRLEKEIKNDDDFLPRNILKMSWEDVIGKLCEKGIRVSKDQLLTIFEDAAHIASNNDGIMDYFWESIKVAIENAGLNEVKSV